MQGPPSGVTVRLRRVFASPRERVFRAWTEPEQIESWLRPLGYRTTVVDLELRVGGRYRFEMVAHDRSSWFVTGVYFEVRPAEKLVYSWCREGLETPSADTIVTVEFHPHAEGTELVLTHRGLSAAESESHRLGWSQALGELDREV